MEKTGVSEELRHARHNVRGRLNALMLSVSALEILRSRTEKLEFITYIEQAADGTVAALDVLEAIHERAGTSEPG